MNGLTFCNFYSLKWLQSQCKNFPIVKMYPYIYTNFPQIVPGYWIILQNS